ncbi:MAG: hypothetical protein ACYC66_11800 [Chloroflexota bacterium]
MTSDEYLSRLRERLLASYDVQMPRHVDGIHYPLYARSQVIAGQYILHRSITYERMELNEHVLCQVLEGPATPESVRSFVGDLRVAAGSLVHPSTDHMSSAITGVLVAEQGFSAEAVREGARSGFTRHFWLGLRGWYFLRLLGIDLATGKTWANRRGREVMGDYIPG